MRAADKTIEFVKEWIAGTYTKRQYQNYYIVKTPHAQFLLKQTEQRELLAIRDLSGHIYLFDNDLSINTYQECSITEDDAMSNPFLCLIQAGFPFKYTRITPNSVEKSGLTSSLSKWKVLDRVELVNESLPDNPVFLSLIEVGDCRFVVGPSMEEDGKPSKCSLTTWSAHGPEKKHKFPHRWPHYTISPLYSNKINTINEIRGNYVAMAGDALDRSWVTQDGWVFIPTKLETIEQITGQSFREAKKTRPNPYAYGLSGGLINLNNLHRRFETIDENADVLKSCINLREEVTSSDWHDKVKANYLPEIAEDIIAYFEADDAWLREHFEIALAGTLEAKLRSKVSLGLNGAIVHVNKEPNMSPLNEYIIYVKPFEKFVEKSTFKKVLPAPAMAARIKGVFDGDN